MAETPTGYWEVTLRKATFRLNHSGGKGHVLGMVNAVKNICHEALVKLWGSEMLKKQTRERRKALAVLKDRVQEIAKSVKGPLVMETYQWPCKVTSSDSAKKPCHLCSERLLNGRPLLMPCGWELVEDKTKAYEQQRWKRSIYTVQKRTLVKVQLDKVDQNPAIEVKAAKIPAHVLELCCDCGYKYLSSIAEMFSPKVPS